jgi:hypothetical protein
VNLELNAMNRFLELHLQNDSLLQNIFVPFGLVFSVLFSDLCSACIDYKGYTLMALTLLPITSDSSEATGGKFDFVKARDHLKGIFSFELEITEDLDLEPYFHRLAERFNVHLPFDLELHKLGNMVYGIDCHRITPSEYPYPKYAHLARLLRPGF